MNVFTLALLCASSMLCTHALAQWQWVDDHGRKVFSDRAPPPQVPAERILRQPSSPQAAAALASAARPAPTGAQSAASAAGIDQELQARKAAQEAQQAEREQAEAREQAKKQARVRQDNCTRARAAQTALADGRLMVHTNAQGERVFMDDATRAAERQRAQALITDNCSPAPR